MEIMSATVGAALPNSAITRSKGNSSAAPMNHVTLATNSAPMDAPYARLSAYTAWVPMRSSSVDPDAENSGFTSDIRMITGICQRSIPVACATPRTAQENNRAPKSDNPIRTGCMQAMVRASVTAT